MPVAEQRSPVTTLLVAILLAPHLSLGPSAEAQRPPLGAAVITSTVTDRQTDSGVDGAVVLLQGTLLRARTSECLDFGFKTGWADDLVALEGTYLLLDSRDLDTQLPLVYRSRHNVTGSITVFDLRVGYRLAGMALQAKVTNRFQAFYVDVMEKNPAAPRNLSLTAYRTF